LQRKFDPTFTPKTTKSKERVREKTPVINENNLNAKNLKNSDLK